MYSDRQNRGRRLVIALFLVALIAHPAVHAGPATSVFSPAVTVADGTDASTTAPHVTCDLCKVRGHMVVEVSGPIFGQTPPGEITLTEQESPGLQTEMGTSSSRAPPAYLFS